MRSYDLLRFIIVITLLLLLINLIYTSYIHLLNELKVSIDVSNLMRVSTIAFQNEQSNKKK